MDNGPLTEWWEGYIANSLPLCQERLNCLLPAKERDIIGQEKSKENQATESFNFLMDLSNDNNFPLHTPGQDGALTLFGFSQFDIPEL